jgi:hypothetical protein
MLINKPLSTVCIFASLLISTIPTLSLADDVCTDISLEQVSEFVSAHQDEWEGEINVLELMAGRAPPPPEEELVFSSLDEAAEAMQSSSDNGSKMTLGTPFATYTILSENLLNNRACHSDFSSLLTFQGIWFVPVFLEDTPVAWLKVYCNNNSLSLTGIDIAGSNSSNIIAELHTLNQKLVDFEVEQSSFVQVFPTKHLFLLVKQHGNEIVYPLRAFPSSYAGLETIDELGGYNSMDVLSKIKEQWPKQEDCTVIYRSDGTLYIPCVTLEGSAQVRYSAILEVIDQKALTFGVLELKDKLDYNGN